MITVTEKAANFLQGFALKQDMSFYAVDEDKKTCYLRVGVLAGGCSGFQYTIGMEESSCETDPNDVRLTSNDISIVIHEKSSTLLNGLIIDYDDGLMGAGLTFTNPSATSTCGCGKSFQ